MTVDDAERRRRFERLFADVYAPVQRYVRRRVGAAAVDDVVADVLLVAWRRLDDVPTGADLPWCYGVARHCVANHRRSASRADRLVRRLAVVDPERPITPDPADPVAADPELAAAFDDLADDDREVLRLWAWEQLGAGEIATVLAITPNAASIRLHRAKRRLAERVGATAAGKPEGTGGHSSSTDERGGG